MMVEFAIGCAATYFLFLIAVVILDFAVHVCKKVIH